MPELRIVAIVIGTLLLCAAIAEISAQRGYAECMARKVEVCE